MTLTLCEIKVTPTSVIDRRSQGGISASVIRRSPRRRNRLPPWLLEPTRPVTALGQVIRLHRSLQI